MNVADNVKYLGDYISCDGLRESVSITVSKRKGLAMKSIYEIRSVLEDSRIHTVGGIIGALDLWEMVVIPSLLYNAETWQEIDTATIEALEKFRSVF